MDFLSKTLSKNWPHCLVVVGDLAAAESAIKFFLTDRFGADFVSTSNPDLWQKRYSSFGIEDSRELIARETVRPVKYPVKIFILLIDNITLPAQNALLKVLEEPVADTYFFLAIRQPTIFLPTILSRSQVITLPATIVSKAGREKAEAWLSADVAPRFDLTRKLLKQAEDEGSGCIIDFARDLEMIFWEKANPVANPCDLKAGEALAKSLLQLSQPGHSARMILEYLAEIVPIR